MNTPSHIELAETIREARAILDPATMSLDQTVQQIAETRQAIDQMRQHLPALEQQVAATIRSITPLLDQLHTVLPQMHHDLQELDNTVTILQRELTHLEDVTPTDLNRHPDPAIDGVMSLLQLSVQLVMLIFPPEQLHALAHQPDQHILDTLRQRWIAWLDDLNHYMNAVLPLARSLADLPASGLLSPPYNDAVQRVQANHTELASIATALHCRTTVPGSLTTVSPHRCRFVGPLGTYNLLGLHSRKEQDTHE
jgi:hypothetical protein